MLISVDFLGAMLDFGSLEALDQAFERFDEDKSGKIDVLEMVEM